MHIKFYANLHFMSFTSHSFTKKIIEETPGFLLWWQYKQYILEN